jgi:hypothetical protein
MILPDDKSAAKRNMVGFSIVTAIFCAIGAVLYNTQMNSVGDIALVCVVVFIFTLFGIGVFGLSNDPAYRQCRNKAVPTGIVAFVVILLLKSHGTVAPLTVTQTSPSAAARTTGNDAAACLPFIGDGGWYYNEACSLLVPGGSRAAYCQTESWLWRSEVSLAAGCSYRNSNLDTASAKQLLAHRKIHFCGDSGIRALYHSLNTLIDPTYDVTTFTANEAMKHSDLSFKYADANGQNIIVEFKWTTRIINMSQCFSTSDGEDDIYVLGMMLWDALQGRDLESYKSSLSAQLPLVATKTAIWVHPQRVVNSALRTQDKQTYMTEDVVSTYRAAFSSMLKPGKKQFSAVVDPRNVSDPTKAGSSIDGVHYGTDVYDTTSQIVLNALRLVKPAAAAAKAPELVKTKAPTATKPPDSMSFPGWGFALLMTSFVMLATMDSFFGVGYLALLISGRSFDYDAAYMPLLKKILGGNGSGGRPPAQAPSSPRAGAAKDDIEEKESLLRSSLEIEKGTEV